MTIAENTRPYLIFVTTAITSGGVLFFQAGAFFCTDNAKCWPILANFGCFVVNLHFLVYF